VALGLVGLGIVVGLTAEAALARPLGRARVGGGRPQGAEAAAERLATDGVRALLSLGVCGGLDPTLKPGALVTPRTVLVDGCIYATDAALSIALGGYTIDRLLSRSEVVAAASEKARLFATTGAAAVDLESGAVARVAMRHGLPFAVLRAVCDPAHGDLPPAARAALDADGSVAFARLMISIARRPGQLPRLVQLASEAAAARQALVRRVRQLCE